MDESVHVSGGLELEVELVAFTSEEAELALEFVASLDVGHVTALKGGEVWVEL